ncbi:MAG: rhodanese-like domain-containing protein [Leptospiraceae bacterium]|nr:rhodanese-like domain-containing protein [Leptospiraceae bacterium]MCP5512459.1 rhodanese-like domain-containing protein [Leptospiraceae bacterium]
MKLSVFFGLAFALLAFCFFIGCGNKVHADKNEISQKIQNGALVVDVRSVEEFASGHYEGAKNIPIDEVSARLSEFGGDKNKDIVLYCRSGGRAETVKKMLMNAGYVNVINAGGLNHMPKVK